MADQPLADGVASGDIHKIVSRKEALATGLKRYFTGKPCSKGHVTHRKTVDHSCVECSREAGRRRYSEDPDRYRAKAKADYSRHTAKRCEASKQWRGENPELVALQKKRHHVRHAEKIRARVAEWVSKNPERARENIRRWAKENPEKAKKIGRARTLAYLGRKKGAEGTFFSRDIDHLFEAQKGVCICGADLALGFDVDHIVPLSKGGSNWPSNLQLLCASCNRSKGAHDMDVWMRKKGFKANG